MSAGEARSRALAAALALCLGAGCQLVKGNGNVTTEARNPTGFTKVVNASSLDVSVSEGDTSVSITIDSNLQSLVATSLDGDTLLIATTGNLLAPTGHPTAQVTLPKLAQATNSGSGALTVGGLSQAHDLILANTGSGPLHFNGPASALGALVSGDGPMDLTGSAAALDATLSGSGSLDAQNLTALGASLTNQGAGNLTATVNATVTLKLTSSGNIDWWGSAAVQSTEDTGSGLITHH